MPLPAAIGFGAKAGAALAGHTSIQAALASLLGNPVWGGIFAQKGAEFLEGIFSPPTPYEQVTKQSLQASADVIPELQAQARGQRSPATQAITRQVRREGTRAGQSFAQGARRAGLVGGAPGGTAPYRAELSRIESGAQEALLQRLGQSQTDALNTLYSGLGGAIGKRKSQTAAREQGRSNFLAQLGDWVRDYKTKGAGDPRDDEMFELIREIIRG